MESYRLENSLLKPAPFPKESEEIIKENKTIDLSLKNKSYPLKISLTDNNIIFFVQEKYSLYYYKNIFSYQEFQNLHKFYRFFDNLNEIYEDLIKSDINIKEENINERTLILYLKININNNIYEINITLNKKELDKYKDIDTILSNYIEMKKELDELKQKFGINVDINNKESNLFKDSTIFKNNTKYINFIKGGIKHQLNKEIINTKLLYRCTKDGDDCAIFHQKCDGIPYTLVIGESVSNKIFGGFTSQKWDQNSGSKNDDNAFIFQLNLMKIYYVIKGKGGIYCDNKYGPTFGNNKHFSLCFQDYRGKSLKNWNREDEYNESDSFEKNGRQNYTLEGNKMFTLKDYEVFELNLN